MALKGFWNVGIAHLVGNVITGVFWLVLAALVGPENYAEINYFLAIAYMLSVVSFVGAGNTLVVYTAKGIDLLKPIAFLSIIISIAISLILFFIFYNVGVSLHVFGFVIFGLIVYAYLGSKLYRQFGKIIIVQKILMVSFAISLYYIIGVNGVILGIALSFLPFSYNLAKALKNSKLNFGNLRTRLPHLMNSYGLDLSRIFPVYADKLIILPLFGLSLLGSYQLGIQILLALSVLPISVFEYSLSQNANGISTKKLKMVTVILSIIFAIAGFFLSPILIPVLFPQYNEAVEIIEIMIISIVPITMSLMYNSKFLVIEKNKLVFIGSGIFLVIQMMGIVFIGQIYGIVGAAIALLLAASIQAIFLIISDQLINRYDKFFKYKNVKI